MKRWFAIGTALLVTLTVRGAEDAFSRTVRAEDFSAAGLTKLSPAELARLDALVRDYKSGNVAKASPAPAAAATSPDLAAQLATAQREVAAAAQARTEAEARATKAEAQAKAAAEAQARASAAAATEKKSEGGLLARAKVLLTPGTQIEYSTVESRIVGDFRGWERRTTFTLENGQRWRVIGDDSYVTPRIANPAVKIAPGMLGTFWMSVEGMRPRVKVEIVGDGK